MVLLVETPYHDPGSQYEPPGKMWLYHAPIDNISRGHIPGATKPFRENYRLTTGRPSVTGERRDTRRLGASRIVACYYGVSREKICCRPMAVTSMISPALTRRRIPCARGAGPCRSGLAGDYTAPDGPRLSIAYETGSGEESIYAGVCRDVFPAPMTLVPPGKGFARA